MCASFLSPKGNVGFRAQSTTTCDLSRTSTSAAPPASAPPLPAAAGPSPPASLTPAAGSCPVEEGTAAAAGCLSRSWVRARFRPLRASASWWRRRNKPAALCSRSVSLVPFRSVQSNKSMTYLRANVNLAFQVDNSNVKWIVHSDTLSTYLDFGQDVGRRVFRFASAPRGWSTSGECLGRTTPGVHLNLRGGSQGGSKQGGGQGGLLKWFIVCLKSSNS